MTTEDAEHSPGLDALAQALTHRGMAESLPPTVGNERTADDPTRAACCSSTALAVCCDPQDKRTCCGEATTVPPAQCGCRA
jgi:hypothetical protein